VLECPLLEVVLNMSGINSTSIYVSFTNFTQGNQERQTHVNRFNAITTHTQAYKRVRKTKK
jgi:hypothetical protein